MATIHFKSILLVAAILLYTNVPWTLGFSSDPCKPNPCGEAAECQLRSNLAVCICPGDTSGDPFVSCKSKSSSTSHGTSSTFTTYTSSSMAPHYTSSTPDVRTTTYSTQPSETSTQAHPSTRFSDFDRYGTATRTSPTTAYTTSSSYPSTTVTEVHSSRHNLDGRDGPISYSTSSDQRDRYNDHNRPAVTSSTYMHRDGNSDYDSRRRYDDTRYHNQNDYSGNMNNRHDYNDNMHRRVEYSEGMTRRHDPITMDSMNRRDDYINDQYSNRRNNYEDQHSMRREDYQLTPHLRNNYNRFEDDLNREAPSRNSPISYHNMNRMEPVASYDRDRFPGSSSSSMSFERNSNSNIRDPMGVYKNCIEVNKIVVCADNSGSANVQSDSTANAPMTSNYNSGSRHPISSNQDNYNDRTPTHNSRASDDHSNFSRRQGGASNVYQELVVSTHHDSKYPPSRQEVRNDEHTPQPGDPEQCKRYCGENAVCRSLRGRAICGCPAGYTGDASVRCFPEENQMKMKNRCYKHTECADNQVCEESQCVDPCAGSSGSSINGHFRMKRMNHFDEASHSRRNDNDSSRMSESRSVKRNALCGSNTQCQVIGHTPLCKCSDGYTGNPYSGCVSTKK